MIDLMLNDPRHKTAQVPDDFSSCRIDSADHDRLVAGYSYSHVGKAQATLQEGRFTLSVQNLGIDERQKPFTDVGDDQSSHHPYLWRGQADPITIVHDPRHSSQ